MGKVQSLLVLLSLIAGAAAQEDQGINPVVEQVSCPELPQETVDEIAQSCAEANEEEICGTECALQASIAIIARLEDAIPCEEATLEDFQSFLTQCITQSFVAAFQQAGVNISALLECDFEGTLGNVPDRLIEKACRLQNFRTEGGKLVVKLPFKTIVVSSDQNPPSSSS